MPKHEARTSSPQTRSTREGETRPCARPNRSSAPSGASWPAASNSALTRPRIAGGERSIIALPTATATSEPPSPETHAAAADAKSVESAYQTIAEPFMTRPAGSTTFQDEILGNLALAEAPGNVTVDALESGLSRDSVVNVSKVATLDKDFLGDRVGSLNTRAMLAVDEGLRTALGL